MRFFSPWLIGSLLAALAMTASNLFALWTRELHTRTSIGDKLLSGLTLLLLWVTFMSHLRAVPSLFQVIHTVGAAYLFFLAKLHSCRGELFVFTAWAQYPVVCNCN